MGMKSLFVESVKRLYKDKKINKEQVLHLFQNGKITEDEMMYILDVKN